MPSSSSSSSSPTCSSYHHCYLLQSTTNPSKTYIGYTTNPQRRIKQHNGILKGGANQTKKHRPWEMKCVIGGFVSDVDGLKFEWAWQNPNKSLIFRSGFNNKSNNDDYDDGHNNNKNNNASNKALINLILKSCGKNNIKRQLTILMILVCQSDYYKLCSLTIYFLCFDCESLFHDLFWNPKNGNYYLEEDDDIEEEDDELGFHNWCQQLPTQMKCQTISSFHEMPFHIAMEKNKRHTKKSKKRPLDNNDNNDKSNQNDNCSLLEERNGDISIHIDDDDDGGDFSIEYDDDDDDEILVMNGYHTTNKTEDIDNGMNNNHQQCNHILQDLQNLSLRRNDDDRVDSLDKVNELHTNDKVIELLDFSSSSSSSNSSSICSSSRNDMNMNQSISSDDNTIDLISNTNNNNTHDDNEELQLEPNNDHYIMWNSNTINHHHDNNVIDLLSPVHDKSCKMNKSLDEYDSDCTIDLCSP